MSKELELAVMDSTAGLARRGKAARPSHTHANCLNCDTLLQGRYCHVCGQAADDHHRSILHLMWEAVEGFTHLDGRLAKTLPALLLHPGGLALDHIEGRRTRHVPPFRLFLITLLIYMFAVEAVVHRQPSHVVKPNALSPSVRNVDVGHAHLRVISASDGAGVKAVLSQDAPHSPLERWLKEHIMRAVDNREYYFMLVFEWAHRLAILMLPILAGLLTVLYVYKRKFYVYDHLVVSMQFLSFTFLLWAMVFALPDALSQWAGIIAVVWTPVNLFMTLRGAYGSSVVGAAGKALFLWLASTALFLALMMGLLMLALNQM